MNDEYDSNKYKCPNCGSNDCEIAYFYDGMCIGCDVCITREFVNDIDYEEEFPDNYDNDR